MLVEPASTTTTATTIREEYESLINHKSHSLTALEKLAHETTNDLKQLQNKRQVQKQVLTAMSLAYLDQQTQEKLLQKISECESIKDLLRFYEEDDQVNEQLTKEVNELESKWKELERIMNARHEELKVLADDVSKRYLRCEELKTSVNKALEEEEQLEREFEELINEDNDNKELLESALKVESFDTDPSQLNSQARSDVDEDLKHIAESISKKEATIDDEKSAIELLKVQLENKKQQLSNLPKDEAEDDYKRIYYFLKKLNELLELL